MTRRIATAAWADPVWIEKNHTYRDGTIWLGRSSNDLPIGYDDDRHVTLVSGTRGGKGTTSIIPTLLTWPGSVCVVDPKGENATVTAARRGKGSEHAFSLKQTVHVLDPFRVATVDESMRSRFNPLDALDPANDETVDEAARIADAIVVLHENDRDPSWDEDARDMVKGLILHVLTAPRYEGRRNLVTVRRLIMRGDWESAELLRDAGDEDIAPAHGLLWEDVAANPAFRGVLAGIGDFFSAMFRHAGKQHIGVLASAKRNTEFIDSPKMQHMLEASDFKLSDLKTRPEGVSLYLSLPQRYMNTHHRWLRMMIALTITEMEKTRRPAVSADELKKFAECGKVAPLSLPMLMVLDEFVGLKRLAVIENAVAQIAGFGVKLFFVLQSLEQLKSVYKDNWETFLANSGLKIFFNIEDHFSREYISKLIGETELMRETANQNETAGETENTSRGQSASTSSSVSSSEGTTRSDTHTQSKGVNHTNGRTQSEGSSHATSRTQSESNNSSTGRTQSGGSNSSRSRTQSEGSNNATGRTQSAGSNSSTGRTQSRGSNTSSSTARGMSSGVSYRKPELFDLFGRRRNETISDGFSMNTSYSGGTSEGSSFSDTEGTSFGFSTSDTKGTSRGSSVSDTEGRSTGYSVSSTDGRSTGYSVSGTEGRSTGHSASESEGVSEGWSDSVNSGRSTTRGESASSTYGSNENASRGTSHTSSTGMNETLHRRPLMHPDEIGRLFASIDDPGVGAYPGLALILIAGQRPVAVRRVRYYEDHLFKYKFDPHPDHPDTLVATIWDYLRAWWEAQKARIAERERLSLEQAKKTWRLDNRPAFTRAGGRPRHQGAEMPRRSRTSTADALAQAKKHWKLDNRADLARNGWRPDAERSRRSGRKTA
jgi:type IV secretory pathway TraG/TraD family ATPase VirD4